jgi:CHAT domain-containing protein/Tfp pilus assembly protein PilF
MDNYDKAEPLFKRALLIREKVLGSEHPSTASALHNLAYHYYTIRAYDKAEPLYKRTLAIKEKILGQEHPDVAQFLNYLALLYKTMGDYSKAEPLYKRSLAIREKMLGLEHPDTAISLNDLAELYMTMGSYDKAEPLYKRSLAIREKVLGPEHPDTAGVLNNVASLYEKMAAYDKAEPLYKRSLAILEKVLGPEHPDTATSLGHLAVLYQQMGYYDKAEPLYKRSLAIKEKVLGPEHPETARALLGLASLYNNMANYDKAEPLYKRSLAILERVLGPEHPDTATSLGHLGSLYYNIGSYDKAEPLYKRALTIYEKILRPEHPDTANSLNNLAGLYVAMGRIGVALAMMERAQRIDRKQIEQILGFASEAQQTQFLATRESNLFLYLSLMNQRFPNYSKAIVHAFDVFLVRKGILLESQKRIQDALAGEDNAKAREIFADLTRVRQELARLVLGGSGKEGLQAYQKRITELTNQKETLEGQLSRLSQAFAQQKKTRIATTATVASALPKGSVLVEMARIQDYYFVTRKWGMYRYIAFVLPAGKGDDVLVVDLGSAYYIDQKVTDFKKSLGNSKTSPDVLAKQSKDLYKIIFAPLTSALGESRQIFLSPDGSLNLIPFEVLQDDQGRYLIETHTFSYVSAGRDIAGYGMVKEKGQKAILMGDPDFDLAAGKKSPDKNIKLALSRSMKGINFSRLPGTKKEVEAIATILGSAASNTYTGKAATESVLTQSKSPRILHLATHGFFLSDQDWSSMMDEKSRGIKIVGKDKAVAQKQVRIENPFLRAGLALAGANNSLAQDGATEGILTAEKILGLNLRGTDMVVLSACETGMGDVKNGEGVYGLRRAFTQAGAKSLVMSMWEVPDVETKELMVIFYKNLQSGKMNRAEALRQAALKQRQTVKARYGSDNPYYWAAFVFLGEAE